MHKNELIGAAHVRADAILAQIKAAGSIVPYIPLTNYATAADFHAILGPVAKTGWTFEEWNVVNMTVMERLRQAGFVVHLAEITAPEFFAWLEKHGLRNNPANRAQYASLKALPLDA